MCVEGGGGNPWEHLVFCLTNQTEAAMALVLHRSQSGKHEAELCALLIFDLLYGDVIMTNTARPLQASQLATTSNSCFARPYTTGGPYISAVCVPRDSHISTRL